MIYTFAKPFLVWGALFVLTNIVCAQGTKLEPGQTPPPKVEGPVKVPTEEESVRLDRDLPAFVAVKDDAPFRYRGKEVSLVKAIDAANEELKAYEYTVEFAARQPTELLKKYSNKKVPWGNLYGDVRHEYLRELLHFEGKLSFIAPFNATDRLKVNGIATLYEAWIYPKGSSELICLVVPELPEGLEPGEDLNKWVAFDAYYFKYMQYESRQKKPDDQSGSKHQWRRAPLFIGRTFDVVALQQPEVSLFNGSMFYAVAGALLVLIAVGAVLGYWFKRGDREVKEASNRRIQESVRFDNVPEQPSGPANPSGTEQ